MKTDNELISEFMGYKPYNDHRYGVMYPDPTNESTVVFTLKYHTSWDWLMPVVEKLEKDHFITITGSHCSIVARDDENGYVGSAEQDNKMLAVYLTVVRAIKYYDSKK
jgi:hypothetical protein